VDLSMILDGISPIAAISCVAIVAIRWKQIGTNTDMIEKMGETLTIINETLTEIKEGVAYLKGVENGKDKRTGGKQC